MENYSLNPILERRAQNSQNINKAFVGGFEERIEKGFTHQYIEERLSPNYRDTLEKSINSDTMLGLKNDLEKSLIDEIDETERQTKLIEFVDTLQKSNVDDLEKGEIMDKMVYGYGSNNDTFKFVKTGKEIKAMLPGCIEQLAEQKGEILAQMQACVEAAGVDPSEDYGHSRFQVIKLKRYPYDLIRQEYNEVSRCYVAMTDSQKACSQYNDLCYSLRSVLEDILACKIILANVEDDKKYNLTISQLVALTLGDDLIND